MPSFRIALFRNIARRFWSAQGGNVAMMFGLAAVPLVVAMGGFVDYSRAYLTHTDMQDALDATALALAGQANLAQMSSKQMSDFAQGYFNANFSDPSAQNVSLTSSYSSLGPSVTVTGNATVPAYFLNLIGIQEMPVQASSITVWGQSRLRVSLVLDNTGSMADDGKMSALKVAAHNLLSQLQNAASVDGDVYVSIIPFVKDVNVGAGNYNQSWVRWDLWDQVNGRCSSSRYSTESTCTSHRKTWRVDHTTWNGCVTDRDQDYDTTNTAPTAGTSATLFPAEQYGNCPQQVNGLTYDWKALNNEIDAMQPNGSTNQAIGLQWGWQSLTAAPFTIPPFDSRYQYKQVIILLTDGLNTQDRWYGNGSSHSSQVDARQETLCSNVKAAGVEVYAVQVDTGGDPTSTLLQDCASDPSMFFLLTSADQIVTTFNSIGTALSDLRISS
jgi:Flp pilus assembly protein TadG